MSVLVIGEMAENLEFVNKFLIDTNDIMVREEIEIHQ
jgi:hypothetical protein